LRIAGIGPAGERLVRFACIINDKHRAAGRSGVGAVMGSKNLKAIAVRGTQGVTIADPPAFMKAVWDMRSHLNKSEARQGMTELGTASTIDLTNAFGGCPTRNFESGQFEHAENINGNSIKDQRMVANKACFACTIACGRVTHLPGDTSDKYLVNMHPRNWRTAGEGPEYEAAWALGADTGVGDLDAVIKANWLCNDLGMDPISMGATLAAAMELYERGILSDNQVEMPLRFGSSEALVRMTEATAYREGFGNELAEGSKRLGDKFQHPEVFMGVKGQEFPAYDPRGFQGMGVAFATCNRGACHLRAWTPGVESNGTFDPHTPVGKSEWVVNEQNRTTSHDATGVCLFTGIGAPLDDLVACSAAATGIPYKLEDFVKAGERTWNLERLWNLKAGMTAADDTLPERLLKEGHKSGPAKGVTVHLDQMLPVYYRTRGWDEQGVPTRQKLAELGLASV
jgi:aldehyde:ferredoxin oxidoreductase